MRERPQKEQALGRDFCGIRSESENSMKVGPKDFQNCRANPGTAE